MLHSEFKTSLDYIRPHKKKKGRKGGREGERKAGRQAAGLVDETTTK